MCSCACLQGNVLLAAAFHGDAPAADLLCQLYTDSLEAGGASIDPNLRGAAYQTAVAGIGGCSPGTHKYATYIYNI